MEPGRGHQVEHRQAGGHRHRIAAERAGLVDRAGRGDLLHQFASSAIGAHRHAAADDLAEGAQVRAHAVARLRAAQRDAEAGHHLVEDQHRAMARAQLAQVLQVALARRQAVGVADHRLDDQAGDLLPGLLEQGGRRLEVVVGQRQGEVGQAAGHARRGRHAEGQRATAGLDQERVAVAVVAAFELDDLAAPGRAARQPDRRQRGLGPGVDHAHHLARGHQRGDALGHGHFRRARRAVRQAVADRFLHRLAHARVVVADDHRAPGADVVDVAVVVHVVEVGAIGTGDEERLPADRLEGAHRRVDAAGHQRARAGEQGVGAFVVHAWVSGADRGKAWVQGAGAAEGRCGSASNARR